MGSILRKISEKSSLLDKTKGASRAPLCFHSTTRLRQRVGRIQARAQIERGIVPHRIDWRFCKILVVPGPIHAVELIERDAGNLIRIPFLMLRGGVVWITVPIEAIFETIDIIVERIRAVGSCPMECSGRWHDNRICIVRLWLLQSVTPAA